MKFDEGTDSLMIMLNEKDDPRCERGIRYKYCDLLLMIIYAVLSGSYTSTDIQFYCELNFEKFKALLEIERIPSHDTFSRILRITDFKWLSDVLNRWLTLHYPEQYKKIAELNVMHIDGKAVRGATAKSEGQQPVYLLNAMYEGGTIMLYTKQIGEKENEQGQMVDFLKGLNIEETVITIDAAGATGPILNYIEEHKGKYLVPIKGNQKKLYNVIQDEIEVLKKTGRYKELEYYENTTKGHGRIEKVKITMMKDTSFIVEKLGLNSFYGTIGRIGVIEKKVEEKEDGEYKVTNNLQYIVTNMEEISVENLYKIKASHWNIEMQHWILDVECNEDRSTIRKDNALINNSILKRFVMTIKNQCEDTIKKLTVNRFNMYCMNNFDTVTEILFGKIVSE